VLRAARETLLPCRPLVVVEQEGWATRFGLPPGESRRILESFGATLVARVVDDPLFRRPSGSA
jgi:hypothetical protein